MKSLFTTALFFVASLSVQASEIVTEIIKSKVLQADVKCNVYLPDGFGKEQETYPVVYLLHGFGQDYKCWCDYGRMQDAADELIETGEACRMVIVKPNAGGSDTMKEWNGYLNMPGWNYEDFFFTELLPQIEKKYNIIGDKEHRAIMGLSMGGGGTIMYGQRHPDMFSACYGMSAWLNFNGESNYPKGSKPCLVQESVREHSAVRFLEKADEETLG